MARMRGARKKPNVARLSGFTGADVPRSLAVDGQRNFSENIFNSPQDIDYKSLTEEQRVKLRAAGYKIPE
jgi:hypothetical protein